MSPAGPVSRARTESLQRLIENVKKQSFVPDDGTAAYARIGGRKVVLPAYVPYVGPEYFQHRPRILCYAINQNLSKHARWTSDWANRWGGDYDLAVDRMNRAASEGTPLPIKPYAEGFIPLAAAIALVFVGGRDARRVPPEVDRVIAATNFVKFSTSEDASSSSIPSSWWRECGRRYVMEELRVLRPDLVLAFGRRTVQETAVVLDKVFSAKGKPRLLACRFPGRIPSVKSRPLSAPESRIWSRHILPLTTRLAKPGSTAYHKWRMLNFPGYFLELVESWGITFAA